MITVFGSHGEVYIDDEGNPVGGLTYGEAGPTIGEIPPEYADITKFDLRRFKEDGPVPPAIDILCVGFWLKGSTYVTPEVVEDADIEQLNSLAQEQLDENHAADDKGNSGGH